MNTALQPSPAPEPVQRPRRVEHVIVCNSAERVAMSQAFELRSVDAITAIRSCATLKDQLAPPVFALLMDFYRKQLVDAETGKAVLARSVTHFVGEQ